MNKVTKTLTIPSLLFMLLLSTGCYKPYHEALMVDVNTSEVAVLVETINDEGQATSSPKGKEGETETDYYKSRLVNARKVQIPYYWKQTKRIGWFGYAHSGNGKWTAAARLIVIDTKPATSEWDNDDKQRAIWVESSDSVGFSTGISLTARIEDRDDAILYLSNYPPESSRTIETKGGDPFDVEITSLTQVMDEEIRSKVQETYSYVSAGFTMDDLRDKKQYIVDMVKNGGEIPVLNPNTQEKELVLIEGIVPFFKQRGITITSFGQFGGFKYENPEIQNAIDKVFQSQQDEEVAKAESKAAEQRKVALKLKGEGEAEQALEIARGKAEAVKLEAEAEAQAIQAVADAKAYELEKLNANPEAYIQLKNLEVQMEQLKSWDGTLPRMMMGGGSNPFMMMNLDKDVIKEASK